MFTAAFVAAAVAASVVSAAPVERAQPAGWATGYLESYDVYHTRYLALDCQDKHNTTFFDQCCHPLLATETLKANRPAQCDPSKAALSSASVAIASGTESSDDGAGSAFATATSSVESVYSQAEATASSSDDNWTAALTSTTAAPATNNNWAPPQTSTSSSSTQQAQPSQSSNNNGGSVQTGGFATYFYQGGNAGACGNYHSDYDMIAAIDIDIYGNTGAVSGVCGKWVEITNTNNGKSVSVQIADVCPSCANSNSIDLSVGAFEAIASLGDGEVPISWTWA